MLLSTVIPVYNTVPWLRRAVDSIAGQDMPPGEHEIVLVDDGSTDGSADVCDEYACRFPQLVRVIHKSNAGVSAARNTGIAAARGEYVHFMDSDDWLIPGSYRYIMENYLDGGFDYVGFHSVTLDRAMRATWVETGDVRGKVIYEGSGRDYCRAGRVLPFSWMGWYRRAFLQAHGMEFDTGAVIAEDVQFNLRFAMAGARMRLTDSVLYRYEVRDGSAVGQREPGRMRRMVESYLSLFEAIDGFRRSDPAFETGARRIVDAQMVPFTSRVLSAALDSDGFMALRGRLKQLQVLPVRVGGARGRAIAAVYSSTAMYRAASLLYRRLFVPYVLPRLPRN